MNEGYLNENLMNKINKMYDLLCETKDLYSELPVNIRTLYGTELELGQCINDCYMQIRLFKEKIGVKERTE